MIRTLSLSTLLAASIALPALAQTTMPTESPSAPTTMAPSRSSDLMLTAEQAKTWIGKPVYSSDNKNVGEVLAFARGTDNKVTEMHAGIGGFLGIGETNVRVMPAQFQLQGDRVILNVTSAQAKDLPKLITK